LVRTSSVSSELSRIGLIAIEGTKNLLAELNESGCPLGRPDDDDDDDSRPDCTKSNECYKCYKRYKRYKRKKRSCSKCDGGGNPWKKKRSYSSRCKKRW